MKKLEAVWESVSLQTKWKLEGCTKPTDGNSATQPSTNNATPTPPPGPAAGTTPTSPSTSPSTAYTTLTTLNATSATSESQSSNAMGQCVNHVVVIQDSQPESDCQGKFFIRRAGESNSEQLEFA